MANTLTYNLVVPVPDDTQGWAELREAMAKDGKTLVSAEYQAYRSKYGSPAYVGLEVTYFGTTQKGERSKRATKDFWPLSESNHGWLLHLIPSSPIRRAIESLAPDKVADGERRQQRIRERLEG